MSTNWLKLNQDKTQLSWFGTKQELAKINVEKLQVGNTEFFIGRQATNLGVHLDSEMTMLPIIQNVCK